MLGRVVDRPLTVSGDGATALAVGGCDGDETVESVALHAGDGLADAVAQVDRTVVARRSRIDDAEAAAGREQESEEDGAE